METHYIVYNNKEYKIQEPTIELWNRINIMKDLTDESEFHLYLISIVTGLSIEQIKEADWEGVYEVSNILVDYFLGDNSGKFYKDFEFNGTKYGFINLDRLTFGEFVDIDEFLSRPLSKRNSELNFLMALFYRELDDKGNLTKYDASKVEERALLFKALPIKYLKGSMSFFLRLEHTLQKSTRSSFHKIYYKMIWWIKRMNRRALKGFGGGIQHLYIYLMRTFSRFKKSQVDHC
jgi:hypothetical protein